MKTAPEAVRDAMRLLILTVVSVALLATVVAVAAPALRDIRATLTGEVVADGLVQVGQAVKDGDPVVWVRTVVGRGVAARAPADGTIAEVLVRPGQVIKEKGAVVARLQESK